MDALAAADISLFAGFRLDRRAGVLFRRDAQGGFARIAIGGRALDILGVLVERPGDLVSRDEIIEAVWPGTVVEDSNLNVQIAALRRILDDGRAEGGRIQTVSGRGYRFVAPVTRDEPAAPAMSSAISGNGSSGPVIVNAQPHGPVAPRRSGSMPLLPRLRARHRLRAGIMAAIIGALGLAAVVALWNWHPQWPREIPPLPRLSIVVLPFTNLNNDPEQQYFTDAVTEDLTTNLSRLSDSFVISRNTAFTYRDKPVNAKQIGRELGVRYVLEGSVRRSGNQIRVNTQLIDAETNAHLWAEHFDSDTVDLFGLQNEITSRIGNALRWELVGAEAARSTADPDALDYILRGRAARARGLPGNIEAIGLFERALALDPGSGGAQKELAQALISRALDGMSASRAGDIARAESLIDQVLAASPRDLMAHGVKGQVLRAQRRCVEAIVEYETVLAFDRNSAGALINIGRCRRQTGLLDEAIPPMEQALRLSPRDPHIDSRYDALGSVHLLQSHIDEAILWFEKARSANPGLPNARGHLASAYALKGDLDRAIIELAEARKLSSDGRYSSIARLKAIADFGVPKVQALFEATYLAGLRKAGMPEE